MNKTAYVKLSSAFRFAPLAARILVWGAIFALVFLLRSFFLLVFLTFVSAYIQTRAVTRLETFIKSRTVRVILVGIVWLGVLVAVGFFLFPPIRHQAQIFAVNYPQYLRRIDAELVNLGGSYQVVRDLVPESAEHPGYSPSAALLQKLLGLGESATGTENVREALDILRNIGVYLLGIASAFLLALLFSFLIVLDLPRLTERVQSLSHSKLSFAYHEVAPSVYQFGKELGRALEAQFLIALANTTFTAIGLWLLGITEKTAFLSMIVFLCSFIPIAGVFISSVPICLIALQLGGIGHFFLAILLITIIHLIEGYVLNPKIFGHHFKINPVFVLIILTVAGKFFGVWGLILGLPICNYVFRYAIQNSPACEQETAPVRTAS